MVARGKEKVAVTKFFKFVEAANKGVIFQVGDYLCLIIEKVKKQTNKQTNWSSFLGFIELHCHLLGKSFFDEGSGIDFEN